MLRHSTGYALARRALIDATVSETAAAVEHPPSDGSTVSICLAAEFGVLGKSVELAQRDGIAHLGSCAFLGLPLLLIAVTREVRTDDHG